LDKLEKEGGRIIRPNKNTQYIVKKGEAIKFGNFQNHNCQTDSKKEDL